MNEVYLQLTIQPYLYNPMVQHEVLLALLGCPGELFNDAFEVEDVDFLSAAEKSSLNDVAGLGASYKVVLAFVDEEEADGLYCSGLTRGLEEQLNEYHDLIVDLEADLIDQPRPLSHLHFKLREAQYHLVLPALARVVHTVVSGPVRGARILELLHEGSTTGALPVKRCASKNINLLPASLHPIFPRGAMVGSLTPNPPFRVSIPPAPLSRPHPTPFAGALNA